METLDVDVGGRARRALLARLPVGSTSMPVVIMLHGAGGTADIAVSQTGWDRKGAEEGFLAAFPEGTLRDPARPPEFRRNPQTWNDGSGRGHVARGGEEKHPALRRSSQRWSRRPAATPRQPGRTGR